MPTILTSWKEIAAYLGKGVRTVQRWELELALPVRRPRANHTVIAVPKEIDEWIQSQTSQRHLDREIEIEYLRSRLKFLEAEVEKLRRQVPASADSPGPKQKKHRALIPYLQEV